MSLKILHTADLHIGKKFTSYPDGVKDKLASARLESLRQLVNFANTETCDLFVVAGDLFDRRSVPIPDVVSAVSILSGFSGSAVLVLPGNHDFVQPDDAAVWKIFREQHSEIMLLDQPNVYRLGQYGIDANVYPAPCDRKTSGENRIGWIRAQSRDPSVLFHIGIAHGSVPGLSPDLDQTYFPMTQEELLGLNLDIWLLGHADGVQYPSSPTQQSRIFNPGTPEPLGFDCVSAGKAWIITLNDDKTTSAKSIATAKYQFLSDKFALNNESELKQLAERYPSSSKEQTILKLTLTGRLPRQAMKSIADLRDAISQNVFHLEFDDAYIQPLITKDDIDQEYPIGSFPHRLLTKLLETPDDVETIQIAYDLLKESEK